MRKALLNVSKVLCIGTRVVLERGENRTSTRAHCRSRRNTQPGPRMVQHLAGLLVITSMSLSNFVTFTKKPSSCWELAVSKKLSESLEKES